MEKCTFMSRRGSSSESAGIGLVRAALYDDTHTHTHAELKQTQAYSIHGRARACFPHFCTKCACRGSEIISQYQKTCIHIYIPCMPQCKNNVHCYFSGQFDI